ncbi:MAG TPA: hypothetical protein VHZ55_24965, partial [Bryobacteraceae bacterium]|nr:hypothetical protein [Bryobacteraceae bacterium]
MRAARLAVAGLLFHWLSLAAIVRPSCDALVHHGKTVEAANCFRALTRSADSFQRAEGYLGLNDFDDANDAFRA